MGKFLTELDEILSSEKVVDKFYKKYRTDDNFKHWLIDVLPEVDKCERQQQNNPWHKYNVLGHILHSVESINRLTVGLPEEDRKMLRYVMLFHDIGKPDTHIVRRKNGEMIDSFFNHNEKSAEIALRALPKLGFDAKQVEVMVKLIFKHDIFMFIKTFESENRYWRVLNQQLIYEEAADLAKVGDGEKLLKYLVLIGRADNLSQNEKMTGESLAMLDQFEELMK